MDAPLDRLAARLLEAAASAGADAADAMAASGTSISVDIREGALEQAERAEGVDIGLRVMIGQRQACVSSSDISEDTITEMATRAVAMAREAPEDPGIAQAEPSHFATDTAMSRLELDDPAPEPSPQELEDAAKAAEAEALSHPGITMAETAAASWGHRHVHLATSQGFSAGYGSTASSLYCVAITGEGTGMERDYFGESRTHRADLPDPAEVGRVAAERTLSRAGARKPPTGRYPVLYDERVAASLVGHLLQAINGTAIVRGASWLRDAMGEEVLPKGMSLAAEPHRTRVSGSRLYDAEGVPTVARNIVDDGVLTGWILDIATARKLGLDTTGSAARGVSSPPSPAAGNIALTQGAQSPDDLMREMGTGLVITSMIGSTISATTGDYSRGASGFWVENGELAYPVNECTVAGNLRDMLKTLVPANDARPHVSRVVPSLLVEGLTLAGD
ncbi:MAG: metallopeptidase TldD-related protein [Pseudomonadota bacterium]